MKASTQRSSTLAAAFVDALADEHRSTVAALPALKLQLAQMLSVAHRGWPQLQISDEAFVRYVAVRLPSQQPFERALGQLDIEGLYLAQACAHGIPEAIKALERVHAAQIGKAIARLKLSTVSPEDFLQILRRKLYLGDETSRPAITQYSGTGPLAAWIRVTAVRVALNLIRSDRGHRHESLEEDTTRLPEMLIDPELEHLKSSYRQAFREAFVEAVGKLSPRERIILRQAVAEGLTVRQIGIIYGVHHVTAARWIGKARQSLTDLTKQSLRSRLQIDAGELDSILGLIQSRFDVSIAGALMAEPAEADTADAHDKGSG